MLEASSKVVDELFYYDDRSDDDSLAICSEFTNVHTSVRPETVPSFVEHEGKFRQAAWNAFEDLLMPVRDQWVLAIDTDEMLVSNNPSGCCLRCEVDKAIEAADAAFADSVVLPVPEVFGFDEGGRPMVRVDGLWPTIRGTRLFRWRPGGEFRDKPMGCGAEPTYVSFNNKSTRNFGLHLMHFGYADERDVKAKYERYSNLLAHGHNNDHIRSIVATPKLQRWAWDTPKLERAS